MRAHLEEEPDEEPEPRGPVATAAGPSTVPSVSDGVREFEYRTELVTVAEVLDGTTLAEQLTRASADGWDLVEIIAAGDRHAILLRRGKRPSRQVGPVGFSPPPR